MWESAPQGEDHRPARLHGGRHGFIESGQGLRNSCCLSPLAPRLDSAEEGQQPQEASTRDIRREDVSAE